MEQRLLLRVESGPMRTTRDAIDLCKDCGPLLENWLADFVVESALSSPEPTTAACLS